MISPFQGDDPGSNPGGCISTVGMAARTRGANPDCIRRFLELPVYCSHMNHPDEALMREAIEDGFTHNTVGCLIVRDGGIIARGYGTIFSEHDPTGHSEVNAIRAASKQLETHELKGCWLYTTFEPCPMCMAAICWAKMDGVVYAASSEDANERWTQEVAISAEEVASRSTHRPAVVGPFLREESLIILDL